MVVLAVDAEAVERVIGVVELDEHHRLVADQRLDVLGPSTAHAIDQPFDPGLTGGHHVDVHAPEVLVMSTFDRLQNRVVTHDANVPHLQKCPFAAVRLTRPALAIDDAITAPQRAQAAFAS